MRRQTIVRLAVILTVAGLVPLAAAQDTDPEEPAFPDTQEDPMDTTTEDITSPRDPDAAAPGTPFEEPGDDSLNERWESEALEQPERDVELPHILFVGVLALVLLGFLWRRGVKRKRR